MARESAGSGRHSSARPSRRSGRRHRRQAPVRPPPFPGCHRYKPAFTALFGFVHGLIGGSHQGIGGFAIRRSRSAPYADTDLDRLAVADVELRPDMGDDAFGDRGRPPRRRCPAAGRRIHRRRCGTRNRRRGRFDEDDPPTRSGRHRPRHGRSRSLTSLKPSRSRQNTVKPFCVPSGADDSPASSSSKRFRFMLRFGSPVSRSWWASRRFSPRNDRGSAAPCSSRASRRSRRRRTAAAERRP